MVLRIGSMILHRLREMLRSPNLGWKGLLFPVFFVSIPWIEFTEKAAPVFPVIVVSFHLMSGYIVLIVIGISAMSWGVNREQDDPISLVPIPKRFVLVANTTASYGLFVALQVFTIPIFLLQASQFGLSATLVALTIGLLNVTGAVVSLLAALVSCDRTPRNATLAMILVLVVGYLTLRISREWASVSARAGLDKVLMDSRNIVLDPAGQAAVRSLAISATLAVTVMLILASTDFYVRFRSRGEL